MAQHWVRRSLSVDDISCSHAPDKRGERTDEWGKAPILVIPRWFGGYRVHDGNDRLYYAPERGDQMIEAEVLVDGPPPEPEPEPKSKRVNLGFGLYWE